ncbi:hypothetical protein Gpo141_00004893 [Globisporangium polare]
MTTKELHQSFQVARDDGTGLRIGVVSAHAHAEIVGPLVTGTKMALLERGVGRKDLSYLHVARPFDLPFAAKALIRSEKTKNPDRPLDGVICLGCMIRDEYKGRFEFESEAVALAIMKLNIKGDIPVVYGVLTCTNKQQALGFLGKNSSGDQVSEDHGFEWAKTVIDLARLGQAIRADAEAESEHAHREKLEKARSQPTTAVECG